MLEKLFSMSFLSVVCTLLETKLYGIPSGSLSLEDSLEGVCKKCWSFFLDGWIGAGVRRFGLLVSFVATGYASRDKSIGIPSGISLLKIH